MLELVNDVRRRVHECSECHCCQRGTAAATHPLPGPTQRSACGLQGRAIDLRRLGTLLRIFAVLPASTATRARAPSGRACFALLSPFSSGLFQEFDGGSCFTVHVASCATFAACRQRRGSYSSMASVAVRSLQGAVTMGLLLPGSGIAWSTILIILGVGAWCRLAGACLCLVVSMSLQRLLLCGGRGSSASVHPTGTQGGGGARRRPFVRPVRKVEGKCAGSRSSDQYVRWRRSTWASVRPTNT